MTTCIIVDDNASVIELMTGYIKQYGDMEIMHVYTDPVKTLKEIPRWKPVDIVFLDIEMPGVSGIRLAQSIRDLGKAEKLMFVTSFNNYASETHRLKADGYLLKPFSFEEFAADMAEIFWDYPKKKSVDFAEAFCYVRHRTGENKSARVKLMLKDIVYVESQSNYLDIYTTSGKLSTKSTLHTFIENLIGYPEFFQLNRSFIVSMPFIKEVQGLSVVMEHSGRQISIGRSYRRSFFERFNAR